jgi:hypothetical protein
MVNYKKSTFKKLSWRRRTTETTISCLDRVVIKNLVLKSSYLKRTLGQLMNFYNSTGIYHSMINDIQLQLVELEQEYISTVSTKIDYMRVPLPKVVRKHITIADLPEDVRMFRFRSKDDLYEVLTGLQFPETMKSLNNSRHTYGGQEVFLLTLVLPFVV